MAIKETDKATGEHTATKKLLCDAIDTNDADRVAAVLKEHYRWLSKESLKSFTPNPTLSQYWRKVSALYSKLGTQLKGCG